MSLPLRWRRIEPGLWAAGPYELRRGSRWSDRRWLIRRDERKWRRCATLREGKELCAEDYARHPHNQVVAQ